VKRKKICKIYSFVLTLFKKKSGQLNGLVKNVIFKDNIVHGIYFFFSKTFATLSRNVKFTKSKSYRKMLKNHFAKTDQEKIQASS
jgi:hypothetical protein